MKTLITILILATLAIPTIGNTNPQNAPSTLQQGPRTPEGVLRGRLESRKDDQASWLVIKLDEPVWMTTQNGTRISSKELQLAGLDGTQWQRASGMLGQMVEAKGNLMEAHSPYHKTNILFLTDRVDPQ